MYKQVAVAMFGIGLVACGGEASQSSSSGVQFSGIQYAPAPVAMPNSGSATSASDHVAPEQSPTPPSMKRGTPSLSSTPDTLSLGTIPLQTRGANGATSGPLAAVAATVTNTSPSWTTDGLNVSVTGSPEIVKGYASCTGQTLAAESTCQDSYMLDCTGAATEGAKSATVTVTDPFSGVSTTFLVSGTCGPAADGLAQLAFTASSADYGKVVQDTSSSVVKLVLKNMGPGATQPLPAPVVTGSREFTVDVLRCTDTSLASLGSCGVSVYLNCGATTAGVKSGSVTYTAPNGGSSATATFTGECVAAATGASCSFNSDCASTICDAATGTCQ